eukprot:TRINITY_DN9711_c0_g1_i1.p1 TRINITY_DN9711_c0_g1~~TRINITY_DN9711_c0_g1_i1.p1  ORF type:complete len:207 (+),score=51.16 TRINITY_DN9711_c0_g1_i1:107-727(+)
MCQFCQSGKVDWKDLTNDDNLLVSLEGTWRAASLPKIIQHLTLDCEPHFAKQFLLTYRTFQWNGKNLDGFDLICMLKVRIESVPPDELHLVLLKTANLIKLWIKEFYFDYLMDGPKLDQTCKEFIASTFGSGNNPLLSLMSRMDFLKPKLEMEPELESEKESEQDIESKSIDGPTHLLSSCQLSLYDDVSFFGNSSSLLPFSLFFF